MIVAPVALLLALHLQAADAPGRRLFASHCAGCHGLDGAGGEHAPNIATSERVQARSDADLARIVHDGVTAGGMPAFGSTLTQAEIGSVIAYLRVLSGSRDNAPLPGDPASGEKLFFSSARCSECHMLAGRGGYFGADLTNYGSNHGAEAIKSAILYPDKVMGPLHESAEILIKGGARFIGLIRNQDNFSVQFQTRDGEFHFFDRSQIATIEAKPIPGHGSETLSRGAVNDIVSYLVKISKYAKAPAQEDE